MNLSAAQIELIGFLSGTVIALSALPRIVDLYRNRQKAASESLSRNGALVFGNVGWVVVGLAKGSPSIAVMCAVASLLNGAVLVLALHSRKPKRESSTATGDVSGAGAVECGAQK